MEPTLSKWESIPSVAFHPLHARSRAPRNYYQGGKCHQDPIELWFIPLKSLSSSSSSSSFWLNFFAIPRTNRANTTRNNELVVIGNPTVQSEHWAHIRSHIINNKRRCCSIKLGKGWNRVVKFSTRGTTTCWATSERRFLPGWDMNVILKLLFLCKDKFGWEPKRHDEESSARIRTSLRAGWVSECVYMELSR